MKYLIIGCIAIVGMEAFGYSITDLLKSNGWRITAGLILILALYSHYAEKVSEWWNSWEESRLQAYYKKNPDKALEDMERVQRARELQQQRWLQESQRDKEAREQREREREEQKRREREELEARLGAAAADGARLGGAGLARAEYLPLSGGGGGGGYARPARRPACPGGGCGR